MTDLHELYRQWIEKLWNGRLSAVDLASSEFIGHWPDRMIRGPVELQQVIDETRGMFTSSQFRLEVGPLVDGDLVAGRWTGMGEMPDGTVMDFFGNDILRARDGKFVEYWTASSSGG